MSLKYKKEEQKKEKMKMSKSDPESAIFMEDTPVSFRFLVLLYKLMDIL